MFFIVNKSQKQIVISDLNIPLGPRQAIDLDKKFGRERADKSKDLSRLIHSNIIEVKIKDAPVSLIPPPEPRIIHQQSTVDVEKLRQDITKEVIASFKEVANELKDHITQNKSVIISQDRKEEIKEQVDDLQLNDDILAQIHAKAVDKLSKDAQTGRVNYEEKQVKENINNNISELENLI